MIFWKRKVLLFKSEVTPGTDPVPVVATDAVLARNIALVPLVNEGEARSADLNYVGNLGRIIAGAYQKLTFEVEIAGAGAAGTVPGYGAALKACAMSQTTNAGVSVVYAPVNPGAETTGTFYLYIGGRLHKATYNVGNVKLVFSRGKIPVFQFDFTGLYIIPSDAALAAPTLTMFQKPVAVNNVNTTPVTLHTFAAKFADLSIDVGNVLTYRNLIASESVRFTDRNSIGSVKLEDELVATIDWWTKMRTAALGALSFTHGIVAGNIVVFAAPNVQLDVPTLAAEENISMLSMNLMLTPSAAGNDEWSITVK